MPKSVQQLKMSDRSRDRSPYRSPYRSRDRSRDRSPYRNRDYSSRDRSPYRNRDYSSRDRSPYRNRDYGSRDRSSDQDVQEKSRQKISGQLSREERFKQSYQSSSKKSYPSISDQSEQASPDSSDRESHGYFDVGILKHPDQSNVECLKQESDQKNSIDEEGQRRIDKEESFSLIFYILTTFTILAAMASITVDVLCSVIVHSKSVKSEPMNFSLYTEIHSVGFDV